MTPTYVTFEQAKLLKEKGYISKSRYYNSSGELVEVPDIPENDYRYTNNSMQRFRWEAPEQCQVREWLRVVYGIWINVEPDCYGEIWWSKLSVCRQDVWDDLDKRHSIISAHRKFKNEHTTPQEAYSAAFDYILKELL